MGRRCYSWQPHPTMLYSLAGFFGRVARGEGALESTMLAYHIQTNRIYLPPAFYPSFILVIFTSRIYVTLNLPINSSASRNGLEHKKILLYCIDSNRLSVFTGWVLKMEQEILTLNDNILISSWSNWRLHSYKRLLSTAPPPYPHASRFVLDASH